MEEKIESRVYRVEAFIIPKANCTENPNPDIINTKVDNLKFSNKVEFPLSQLIEEIKQEEEKEELKEEEEEEDKDLLRKSNNAENLSSNQVDIELPESPEHLNISDSSKKDSINSFNEYQEGPDFDILIKSPELRESYSSQIEGDEKEDPSEDQTRIFPGLKKCLADFLEEEQKEKKIQKESWSTKKEDGSDDDIVEESLKEESLIMSAEETEEKIEEEEIEETKEVNEIYAKRNNIKNPKCTDYPIYDEPFVGTYNRDPRNSRHTLHPELNLKSQGIVPYSKPPRRCHSLKSIDEGVEILDTNFEDICYHGHKNGCTVAVQKPEDVSQDIFRDNWMQRLETLRQREALLRDKEVALQSRERLLFKKEKELRILERMVKDRMQQAELYLKRCKNSQSLENVFEEKNVESKSHSDGVGGSRGGFVLKPANNDKRVPFVGEGLWLKAPELKFDVQKENWKNPPPPRSSLTLPSYSSFRSKPRPKISYDDLDSTLSAGDVSHIVTSRKFDPVVFKKPAAFSRSASERRPKTDCTNIITKGNKCSNKEEYQTADFEENKIMRKVSENIFVSQDKDTKYQDYGIIDKNVDAAVNSRLKSDEEEKKYGYLNLEVDASKSKRKSSKGLKTRPTSWSAETDNWLQKKREAYNSANRKCVHNLDKENNLDLNPKTKPATAKKKCVKGKKFSIFR
ncbi:DNA ligase 1-like [Belonocnema kinseyi]|uniref:DNA ligase 1-like n=1 Tax=Belonocnema kinseyi TaxID=2817044 RepID=UPI00143DE453|nr:DNA ligase 1-like [Belonocnema kinseyi]